MAKNLKILIFVLIILVLVGGGIFVLKTKKENKVSNNIVPSNLKEGLIYFYGQGCPHCAKVEKFFEENKIEEKIKFEKREVFSNKENAKLLISIAKEKCNFNENQIGVPFLWDGGNSKCIVGDQPIIDYFKEKIAGL